MTKIRTIFQQYLHGPVPGAALGLFRIMVAAFALLQLVVLLPNWALLFGEKGIIPWVISDALATKHIVPLSGLTSLFTRIGMGTEAVVTGVSILYAVSLLGLLLGYRTRVMAITAWLLHGMLCATAHLTAYGVESFLHIALFYCMVFPVGVSKGLDSHRRYYQQVSPATITLCIRVLQCHLAIMYAASGIEKALGEQWWNGDAIWIALQQEQFRQADTTWMAGHPWLPKLLGWATVLLETTYVFTLNHRPTRKIALCAIVGMHLFIGVFLGLHLFALLMILLNLSAFGWKVFPGIFNPAPGHRKTAV